MASGVSQYKCIREGLARAGVLRLMDEARVYSRRLPPNILGCGVISAILTLIGIIAFAAAVVLAQRNIVVTWSLVLGTIGLFFLSVLVRNYLFPALTVTTGELLLRRPIGTRRFQRADLARIIRFTYDARNGAPRLPLAIFLRHDGTRMFQLGGLLTDASELDALFARLGLVPEGSWLDVLTPAEAEQKYAKAIPAAMSSRAIRWGQWGAFALVALWILARFVLHR